MVFEISAEMIDDGDNGISDIDDDDDCSELPNGHTRFIMFSVPGMNEEIR